MEKQWFESWFDTRYYHLLYKNRDDREAQLFLDLVLKQLPIRPPAAILDLACGKGRHAIYLAQKGFDVTGVDLSPANIAAASEHAHAHLRFGIKDMRDEIGNGDYDAVFNLFTGFGYFETDEENFSVFRNVARALKPGGSFLFDYLNESYVRRLPTDTSEFKVEGIAFRTGKEFRGRWVIKHIEVDDNGRVHRFEEKVAMYSREEITDRLLAAGFQIGQTFGDYHLAPYSDESPRLILTAFKTAG